MSKGFKKTMQMYKRGELKTVRGRTITDKAEAVVHACAVSKAEKVVDRQKKK